ncbi:MAG TPA: diphosphate--fructose-6-phosphate 1-phosphotransferase [Ktedonobacterales bacterium]|jgi:6-phosphofructokinase 1
MTRQDQGSARGHLLVGQSGGATAVINASLVGVVRAALASDAVDGIYGARHGIEGLLGGDVVDLRREPGATWDRLLTTPSAALGSCRYKLQPEDPQRALDRLRALGVRFFIYIGGNDSADTAHRIAAAARAADYDLRVVCLPKTIDNDLPGTDHCPGYGSAARFVALATQDSALCTAALPDHYPVKIIEVMGRDAGWLAAAAALGQRAEGDAPHLIYVPERPFARARFLDDVRRVHREHGWVVVVAAETIRDEDGRKLGEADQQGADAFGHPLLSGTAQVLVSLVRAELGLRARFDRPGDLQRMSSACVSAVDRDEAERAGRAAVAAALTGESDQMVTLVRAPGPGYACDTGLVPLARVANEQRLLPDDYLDAAGTGVTQAFRDYALPLLGAPLPEHGRLRGVPVAWGSRP